MKNKKFVIVMVALLLSLVGCNKLPSDKVSQANGYSLDEETYRSDKVNKEEVSLAQEGEEQGYQNQKSSVPQIYIDYMNEHSDQDIVSSEDIAFYHEEDIDLDGKKEAIIAVGIQDEDPLFSQLSHLYVLRNENNHVKQIGDNLALGGYGVYEVKLINLQDSPKKYIYCGLTNGNLTGFKIVELSGNDVQNLWYSASATGSGDDELQDFNQDGQYDGYVESRGSYDVLYFTTERIYVYKDNQFVLDSTWVDIPEYPTEAEEVIMQYFSLSLLEDEKSKEVTERLTKIFEKHSSQNYGANPIVPYSVMVDTLAATGEGLNIDLTDIGEGCMEGTISFTDEDGIGHQYYIILSNATIDGRWRIEDIQKL